jgi:hypothetical protein
MFTDDQREFLDQKFSIMTQSVIREVVSEVIKKIEDCEKSRCCKGVDFSCVATKEESNIYQRSNVLKVISIVIVTMFFVELSGGIDKVVKAMALKTTATERFQ